MVGILPTNRDRNAAQQRRDFARPGICTVISRIDSDTVLCEVHGDTLHPKRLPRLATVGC